MSLLKTSVTRKHLVSAPGCPALSWEQRGHTGVSVTDVCTLSGGFRDTGYDLSMWMPNYCPGSSGTQHTASDSTQPEREEIGTYRATCKRVVTTCSEFFAIKWERDVSLIKIFRKLPYMCYQLTEN